MKVQVQESSTVLNLIKVHQDVKFCLDFSFITLSNPRKAGASAGHPCGARAFHKLRRYHSRTNRFTQGQKMYNLGKLILGTQISTAIFFLLIRKIQIYTTCFKPRYLKTAQKTVQSLKNGRNIIPNFLEISYRDKCSAIFFYK